MRRRDGRWREARGAPGRAWRRGRCARRRAWPARGREARRPPHPARERAGTLGARVPEAEALEQHPDPLAALGHAVEAAVELEVLQRRELAVDERLGGGE